MRARVRVTGLGSAQWNRVQSRLKTSYDLPEGAPSVCAEFESGHPQGEVRHVQMPVQEFATVLTELAAMDRTATGGPAQSMANLEEYVPGQGNGAGWND